MLAKVNILCNPMRKKFPKKIGPWKFRDWAKIALFGPPGTLKGPDIRSKCVVTIILIPSDHLRTVGTKSGLLGPSEDLGAPQKGFSGQNRALLRPPGAQKGPDIRSKCVLTMSLTQAGQWGAVGTKSGPPGPLRTSGGPNRAFWGQNEPFWGPQECRRSLLRGHSA